MSDPRIWSQDWWNTLHRAAIAYPDKPSDDDKQMAREYFRCNRGLLPCPACRLHYGKMYDETFTDSVLESSEALQRWVYDSHCAVNRRLGIENKVRFEDVRGLVNKFPTRFIDLDTGKILQKARYVNDGGVSSPHEARARAWLEQHLGQALDDRPLWEKVIDPLSEKEQRISRLVTIAASILAVFLFVVLPMHFYYTYEPTPDAKQQETRRPTLSDAASVAQPSSEAASVAQQPSSEAAANLAQ